MFDGLLRIIEQDIFKPRDPEEVARSEKEREAARAKELRAEMKAHFIQPSVRGVGCGICSRKIPRGEHYLKAPGGWQSRSGISICKSCLDSALGEIERRDGQAAG